MRRSLMVALALTLGVSATLLAAEGIPWLGSSVPLQLFEAGKLHVASTIPLAVYTTPTGVNVAVAWNIESQGVTLKQRIAGEWSGVTTYPPTGAEKTWFPSLTYSGSQLLTAWSQGTQEVVGTPRTVYQQDVGQGGAPVAVGVNLYGQDIAPEMVAAPTGIHMIFSAAPDANNGSKGDLYYAYRPLTQSTWTSPTRIVTSAYAIPAGELGTGGIWYPRLALNTAGTSLHIVWEQVTNLYISPTVYVTYSVWHIAGQWTAGAMEWQAPEQLSPPEHHAMRPTVAVDGAGTPHVAWSELYIKTGAVPKPDGQYATYYRISADHRRAEHLTTQPLRVNDNFPTYINLSLAAAEQHVCISWHGYSGEVGKEEIWLRCSQDSGATWDALLNASETPDLLSVFPRIQFDNRSILHLTWSEYNVNATAYYGYYRSGNPALQRIMMPVVLRKEG